MRQEFSAQTKREAWDRSEKRCEGLLSSGESCNANLEHKPHHYDHVIPDGIGGPNDLQNCAVLCLDCHGRKTNKKDKPLIAKSKRVKDKYEGRRKRSSFACSRDSKHKKKINGEVVLR